MDHARVAPDSWAPLAPDDESLRAGVASTYSVAASISVLVIVVWTAISFARWQPLEPGGPGFLETCAQVLPVLLLTFAIERVFFERTTSLLATRASTIVAFGSVLLLAGLGEVTCLVALAWTGGPPAGLRTLAGLLAIAATAGSVTLIVGFAAVRSGVVLDLRAGLGLVLGRAPDEPDPRASIAARAAAGLLASGGVLSSVVVISFAIGFAVGFSPGPGTAVAIVALGTVLAGLVATPSALYFKRDNARKRALRGFWSEQPAEIHHFASLTRAPLAALPYAPQQVFLSCFFKLVNERTAMTAWPAIFAAACRDERLTVSEQAALKRFCASLDAVIAEVEASRAAWATSA